MVPDAATAAVVEAAAEAVGAVAEMTAAEAGAVVVVEAAAEVVGAASHRSLSATIRTMEWSKTGRAERTWSRWEGRGTERRLTSMKISARGTS